MSPTCCWRSPTSRPQAIIGRARRYGLQTDASQRFERGVDPQGQGAAMDRATALLLQLCGGSAGPVRRSSCSVAAGASAGAAAARAPGAADRCDTSPTPTCSGASTALGMQVQPHAQGWQVTPPSWRFDISIEADLIEEVLRIVGFDAVQEQPRALAAAVCPAQRVTAR